MERKKEFETKHLIDFMLTHKKKCGGEIKTGSCHFMTETFMYWICDKCGKSITKWV